MKYRHSEGNIDFGHKATNEWVNNLQKSMGTTLFTSRYELILKCMKTREWYNKMEK